MCGARVVGAQSGVWITHAGRVGRCVAGSSCPLPRLVAVGGWEDPLGKGNASGAFWGWKHVVKLGAELAGVEVTGGRAEAPEKRGRPAGVLSPSRPGLRACGVQLPSGVALEGQGTHPGSCPVSQRAPLSVTEP